MREQAIEIHPYDFAELLEKASPQQTFTFQKLQDDCVEFDGTIYHQNIHMSRKPGPHTIE